MLSLLFHHFHEDVQELVLMDYKNWKVEMPDKVLIYDGNNPFVLDKLDDKYISLLVNAQVALLSRVSRNNLTRNLVLCKGEDHLALLNKIDPYILRLHTNFLPF